MRTDTQRLDYVLTIVEQQDEEAADKLGAAYTLGFRGRVMIDAAMGARVIEPGQPMPELTALDLVGAELGRIRNVKGFSEERDDGFHAGFLDGRAAAYLLAPPNGGTLAAQCWVGPWSDFKPSPEDRKKELTKGIALAVCELDRLIRAERREVDERTDLEKSQDIATTYACVKGMAKSVSELPMTLHVDGIVQPHPREFKVGDRVRIASNAEDNPWGWCPEMDEWVGSIGSVVRVFDEDTEQPGFQVTNGLIYPSSQLEHVDG